MTHLSKQQKIAAIGQKLDSKIKPVGALGEIERLAAQLALLQSKEEVVETIEVKQPTLLLFAADHGVAEHGVSIAPSDVTTLMVTQFLSGGAAINSFVRSNDIKLLVIDAGMKTPAPEAFRNADNYSIKRIASATKDLSIEPAMNESQLALAISHGKAVFKQAIESGSNLILLGEMGIGNTTSASAIMSGITGIAACDTVGKGTGVSAEKIQQKISLIEQALSRFDSREPMTVLQQVGGFEIAQMVGVILAAEKEQTPVVIDGFIVSSAALVATCLSPSCADILIYAHCSDEKAHRAMLAHMSASPLLSLGLRLGEGTGAALAVPIIKVAVDIYNNMKTFADLGIELP